MTPLRPLPLFAALLAAAPMVSAMPAANPAEVNVAPLKLPPIHEEQLDNGLSIVTVERTDLPLVSIRLVLPAGSARDPKGREGLASFTAGLLRRGTDKHSADELDDAIESIGGLLGVDAGADHTSLGVTLPSEHAGTALGVMAELVREASFPKREFDLAKRRELAQLQQDLDDPSGVADLALGEFFYGADHPYGHPGQGRTASVGKFTLKDVKKFRDQTYTPQGALLLFVGDVQPKQALELARKAFGGWKGPKLPSIAPPPPEAPKGLEILLVDKPDATQAQVRMAVPGIARKDSRYHATVVANTILGGGFTARLMDEVRVNRGLTYGISTRAVALREFGAVSLTTFTKTETVREILDVSLKVLDDFRAKGPTADEVEKAKRYAIGLYPARVEGNEALSEALASVRELGLPFDELERFRGEVARASLEQVQSSAGLFPSTAAAKVVIVGAASKIKPQLEGLGRVTVRKAATYR